MRVAESIPATAKGFFGGVMLFVRGAGLVVRRPGLYTLGLIPALISFVVLMAGIASVIVGVDAEVGWIAGFTEGWAAWLRAAVDVAVRIAVVGLSVLISMWAFTSVALALGQPFYERICSELDDQVGVPQTPPSNMLLDILVGLRDSIRVGVLAAAAGLGLFVAEFIPVVGQTVVPVIVVLFGGWVLIVELTGLAFTRRGFDLAQRRKQLHAHQAQVLGLGATIFLVFLVPFGAVLFMPVAVAAATLLAQHIAPQSSALAPAEVPSVEPV